MPPTHDSNLSAFSSRKMISSLVENGDISINVLHELLPGGEAFQYEKQLWDYKLILPTIMPGIKLNESQKKAYNCSMAEIIKDVVSFYNSYGGYIVVGIRDKPREIVGFDRFFDCDDLNKRLLPLTKHEIDCHFVLHDVDIEGLKTKIGLLFIPKRPDSKEPAQFLRDGPESDQGHKAFKTFDIYFRQGSECKPAITSEDLSFLWSPGRRQFASLKDVPFIPVLENNLGPRDPEFIRFIGREDYLQKLWRWLCDKYSPCKLLAGLGGVGKTTIARVFTDDIIKQCPFGFERVIWLSAKKQYYASFLGGYKPVTRVDFTNTNTLLKAILSEIGWPENKIDLDWTRNELMDTIIETLIEIPIFIVIDDIDSLDPQEQIDAFQTIIMIMSQTIGRARFPSRSILTARLDLGAAPGQMIHITGMDQNDFIEYLKMVTDNLGLSLTIDPRNKLIKKFHRVTDGSPIFVSSILRLLTMGFSLDYALDKWKGSDGEEIRKFAFQKELENLNESQLRTLYAACILGETSVVELKHITESNNTLLSDDIAELRKFHLIALGSEIPRGGSKLIIPNTIRLLGDTIKDKISNPKAIEKRCANFREKTPRLGADVGMDIHRIVALWKENEPEEALEVAKWAEKQNRSHPDLKCILGRAYLRLNPPDSRKADAQFKKACDLGCVRPELFDLWIETKIRLGDWIGVIEVTELSDYIYPSADNIYNRAKAYYELAESAKEAGDLPRALGYYLEGGKITNEAFAKGQGRRRVAELKELRIMFFQSYVNVKNRITRDSNEYIEVWLSCLEAFNAFVRSSFILKLGIEKLENWWHAVELRGKYDEKAVKLMEIQMSKLDRILNEIDKSTDSDPFISQLLHTKRRSLNKDVKLYISKYDNN